MAYSSKKKLPKAIQDSLPSGAQAIYKEVFNKAQEFYEDPSKRRDRKEDVDEVASKVAWSAVKKKYKKIDSKWKRK
jgi:cation transport regulator